MSDVVLPVAGAVIGGIYGGPAGAMQGYAWGSAAAAVFQFDDRKNQYVHTKMTEGGTQGSSFGAAIPKVRGHQRVPGTLMWKTKPDKFVSGSVIDQGLKDVEGPTKTTITVDFAMAICEGPVIAVPKLYYNGNLLYDLGAETTGLKGIHDGVYFQSRNQRWQDGRIGGFASRFRVYQGTEDQPVDPFLQGIYGAGLVPAFRGLCWAIFESVDVTLSNGLIMPMHFDVIADGSKVDLQTTYSLGTYSGNSSDQHSATLIDSVLFNSVTDSIFVLRGNIDDAPFGVHVEERDPLSGDILSTNDFYTDGSNGQKNGWTVDLSRGHVYVRNDNYRIMRLASGGGGVTEVTGIGGASNLRGICYVPEEDQVWVSAAEGIRVYAADGWALVATFGVGGDHMTYCPETHQVWVMGASGDSYVYTADTRVLVQNLGSFNSPRAYWDPRSDSMWIINNSGAASARIYRYDPDTFGQDFSFLAAYASSLTIDTVESMGVYVNQSALVMFELDTGETIRTVTFSGGVSGQGHVTYSWLTGALWVAWSGNNLLHRVTHSRFQSNDVHVSDLITEICESAGLSVADIDVATITDTIDGVAWIAPSQAKPRLEALLDPFFITARESGYKLEFIKRGGASVATITPEEMGAYEGQPPEEDAPEIERGMPHDLPSTLEFLYYDADKDFAVGKQQATRIVPGAARTTYIQSPLAITATQAKRAAEGLMDIAHTQQVRMPMTLTHQHMLLDAGDPITVMYRGKNLRILLVDVDSQAPGIVSVKGVLDDAASYVQTAEGAEIQRERIDVVEQNVGTILHVLDIPILRDEDNYPGVYVAGNSRSGTFRGGTVFVSSTRFLRNGDLAANPFFAQYGISAASMGQTITALASGNVYTWDDVSTFDAKIRIGTLPVSVSDDDVIRGANRYLVGQEIIQAATIVSLGGDVYRFSRLLRGRLGTEWAVGTHTASGERVIALPEGLTRVRLDLSQIGATLAYSLAPNGISRAALFPVRSVLRSRVFFSAEHAGLKPYAPVGIGATRDGGGNISGYFIRRARLDQEIPGGRDILLGEESEEYEIDVMDGATVKRTITTTSETFGYSAADQTTDFGSVQAAVLVNVYQMSASIGRGYPGVATI